jgi:hypothetical protein
MFNQIYYKNTIRYYEIMKSEYEKDNEKIEILPKSALMKMKAKCNNKLTTIRAEKSHIEVDSEKSSDKMFLLTSEESFIVKNIAKLRLFL